jgi:hypothetical protein
VLTALLPRVAINSINIRYNLYAAELAGAEWAYFWGSVAPFTVAWLFSSRELAVRVVLWALMVVGGWVNFVLPPYLYYLSRKAGPT